MFLADLMSVDWLQCYGVEGGDRDQGREEKDVGGPRFLEGRRFEGVERTRVRWCLFNLHVPINIYD